MSDQPNDVEEFLETVQYGDASDPEMQARFLRGVDALVDRRIAARQAAAPLNEEVEKSQKLMQEWARKNPAVKQDVKLTAAAMAQMYAEQRYDLKNYLSQGGTWPWAQSGYTEAYIDNLDPKEVVRWHVRMRVGTPEEQKWVRPIEAVLSAATESLESFTGQKMVYSDSPEENASRAVQRMKRDHAKARNRTLQPWDAAPEDDAPSNAMRHEETGQALTPRQYTAAWSGAYQTGDTESRYSRGFEAIKNGRYLSLNKVDATTASLLKGDEPK
jgi:hypothetical protein